MLLITKQMLFKDPQNASKHMTKILKEEKHFAKEKMVICN